MARYMLILRDDPAKLAHVSPAEMQQIVERYRAWARAQAGRVIPEAGNKLADKTGRVLTSQAGKVSLRDGPFAETKDVIGGYFMVEAPDYDQAVAIARTCPHVEFDGSIEVRLVESR